MAHKILGLHYFYFYMLNVVRFFTIVSLGVAVGANVYSVCLDVQHLQKFTAGGDSSGTCTDYRYIPGTTLPDDFLGKEFSYVNRGFIVVELFILIVAEFGWLTTFFDHFFPVLGKEFGLFPLGFFQVIPGLDMLSHYSTTFGLVSGLALFICGGFNIVLGLTMHKKAKARRSLLRKKELDEEKKKQLPTTASGPWK